MSGKVWLIGAGCGAKDLITLRGLRALRECDAVVYDDLIDPALLREAPGAEKIYMGKRNGRHSAPQEEITAKLIELAEKGRKVARLKGGDPFVFGRGGEEALGLIRNGIPFEEIPGISSSIAIPACAGIPVTHRRMSRGFMVVTGHTAAGGSDIPEDIDTMASFRGTVVILMGLSRLDSIAEALIERGKDPETPAAVISGGNAPRPMTVRGKLSTIAGLTAGENVEPPAVIVIGDTAGLDLRDTDGHLPLRGKRVGTTGTPAFGEKLREALERKGAEVVAAMSTEVEELAFPLQEVLEGVPKWLVFTSANGVRTFFDRIKAEGRDIRSLAPHRFAVIGRPTGRVLAEYGINADLCPERYTSMDLAELLAENARKDEEIVLLRAANATPALPEALRADGFRVREVHIYSVIPDEASEEEMRGTAARIDYLTFSSAGGARLWMETRKGIPEGVRPVAIGPVTAAEMERLGIRDFITARKADAESIAEAITEDAHKI